MVCEGATFRVFCCLQHIPIQNVWKLGWGGGGSHDLFVS